MRSLVAALMLCLFMVSANAEVMSGMASVDYGRCTRFDGVCYHGLVATGARFKASILAVAHRTLPLGSSVVVKYRDRTAVAIVNDRGPCLSSYCRRTAPKRIRNRVLDMTPAVAKAIGFPGLGRVSFWTIARTL